MDFEDQVAVESDIQPAVEEAVVPAVEPVVVPAVESADDRGGRNFPQEAIARGIADFNTREKRGLLILGM